MNRRSVFREMLLRVFDYALYRIFTRLLFARDIIRANLWIYLHVFLLRIHLFFISIKYI
jgi:hypothetical protein